MNNFEDIERLQKTYCGHRDANCVYGKFIEDVMKASILIKSEDDNGQDQFKRVVSDFSI